MTNTDKIVADLAAQGVDVQRRNTDDGLEYDLWSPVGMEWSGTGCHSTVIMAREVIPARKRGELLLVPCSNGPECDTCYPEAK